MTSALLYLAYTTTLAGEIKYETITPLLLESLLSSWSKVMQENGLYA